MDGLSEWNPISTFSGGEWSQSQGVTESGAGKNVNVRVQDTVPVATAPRRFMRLKVTHP